MGSFIDGDHNAIGVAEDKLAVLVDRKVVPDVVVGTQRVGRRFLLFPRVMRLDGFEEALIVRAVSGCLADAVEVGVQGMEDGVDDRHLFDFRILVHWVPGERVCDVVGFTLHPFDIKGVVDNLLA